MKLVLEEDQEEVVMANETKESSMVEMIVLFTSNKWQFTC